MDEQKDTPKDDAPKEDALDNLDSLDMDDPKETSSSYDMPSQAPADALSRTPDDLEEEQAEKIASGEISDNPVEPEKKVSAFRQFLRRANLYLLSFLLIFVGAVIFGVVTYINSQKDPVEPTLGNQTLSEDALKQLANTDASVGNSSQTLTIQGNAVIAGQTLARGNLSVAGDIQAGGRVQAPNITVSGASNLATAQIQNLQVATNATIQGTTTTGNITVSGTSSFGGPMTASQITVTNLVLAGNATLQVPNHIRFTGPSPNRTINNAVLGGGGTASVEGSDTAGTVNINSGNNPTPGCFTRVIFQQAFSSQPRVTVTPVGSAAGNLGFYVERNTTGFSICTRNGAPGNQSFAFDYFVTGS